MTGPECYRFVLGHPMVDMAWCAATTAEELRADVEGVLAGPLEPDRLEEVAGSASGARVAHGGRRWMFGSSSGLISRERPARDSGAAKDPIGITFGTATAR